jgi:hypothetical protein
MTCHSHFTFCPNEKYYWKLNRSYKISIISSRFNKGEALSDENDEADSFIARFFVFCFISGVILFFTSLLIFAVFTPAPPTPPEEELFVIEGKLSMVHSKRFETLIAIGDAEFRFSPLKYKINEGDHARVTGVEVTPNFYNGATIHCGDQVIVSYQDFLDNYAPLPMWVGILAGVIGLGAWAIFALPILLSD